MSDSYRGMNSSYLGLNHSYLGTSYSYRGLSRKNLGRNDSDLGRNGSDLGLSDRNLGRGGSDLGRDRRRGERDRRLPSAVPTLSPSCLQLLFLQQFHRVLLLATDGPWSQSRVADVPILKREVDLFPSHLFELSRTEHPWWVAYVRSRQEKALARHLAGHGVGFYLPQAEKRTRRAGRTFVSSLPLFPGYLFYRGTAEARRKQYQRVLDLIASLLGIDDDVETCAG